MLLRILPTRKGKKHRVRTKIGPPVTAGPVSDQPGS